VASAENEFLKKTEEKLTMNQYWFSAMTIDTMVNEIEKVATRVTFLSTPSVYFSLKNQELKRNSRLFDIDEAWASDPGFVKFNFKEVDKIPKEYHHYFDYVVIDPPFVTDVVWEQYARAAKLVLVLEDGVTTAIVPSLPTAADESKTTSSVKTSAPPLPSSAPTPPEENPFKTRSKLAHSPLRSSRTIAAVSPPAPVMPEGKGGNRPESAYPTPTTMPRGKVLLTTISEHEGILNHMLGATIRFYRPSIPTLIYQYVIFTNYNPEVTGLLNVLNPEVDDESAKTAPASPEDEDELPRKSKYGGFGSDSMPSE